MFSNVAVLVESEARRRGMAPITEGLKYSPGKEGDESRTIESMLANYRETPVAIVLRRQFGDVWVSIWRVKAAPAKSMSRPAPDTGAGWSKHLAAKYS